MIELNGVCKSFSSQRVLRDISFQVPGGEIFGLVGYNGVGKTTLMKLLCGIYRPDGGSIAINGQPVYENPRIKRTCFFMTEEATFFPQSSMLEMRIFYRGYYPKWSDKTFYGLAEWFGLDTAGKIGSFSKGMQRQASLTLALSTHANYLFLDEAFDGLDFTMRRQVRDMLLYYVREKQATAVISSHNLRELEGLASRIGMLSGGGLVFCDTTVHMHENYQTCRFRYDGPPEGLAELDAELLEREGDRYLCVLGCSGTDARGRFRDLDVQELTIRPVALEEFFRKERKEKEVDFHEIFG